MENNKWLLDDDNLGLEDEEKSDNDLPKDGDVEDDDDDEEADDSPSKSNEEGY